MGYVNLKSVTFWSGALLVLKAVLQAFDVHVPLLEQIPSDALLGTAAVGLRRAVGAGK